MKKIFVFSLLIFFVVVLVGCFNFSDPVGSEDKDDDSSCVVDNGKDTTKVGGIKKPDEPKKEEPSRKEKPEGTTQTATQTQTQNGGDINITVPITIVHGNGNQTGQTTQTGEVVNIPEEKPTAKPDEPKKEEPKVEPKDPDKPKEPEKPVVTKPELCWDYNISGDKIKTTLSMKNPGKVKWTKLVLNFDYSLVSLEIVDQGVSWQIRIPDDKKDDKNYISDLLRVANTNGQLELKMERVGEDNKICSFIFSSQRKKDSLIGLSGFTAFYETEEDMKAGKNKVSIPFPTPIEVIRE